ncbi:MAG: hypothetical protein WA825_16470 [Steroidobacteraceae bacterium]
MNAAYGTEINGGEMNKINLGRVLLGGLVAGIVIDIIEIVANGLLAVDLTATLKALGQQPPSRSAIVTFSALGLVTGIASIWSYAAIRPRFGAGARTAVIAGLGIWVVGYAVPYAYNVAHGVLPFRLGVILGLVGLVEIILACIAGSAVYKER